MARIFRKNHTRQLCLNSVTNPDWLTWLVAETVRRTLFLVHVINILTSLDENARPSYYFEQLDDVHIRKMQLPAPDELWEARSTQEWEEKWERLGWTNLGGETLEEVMSEEGMKSWKNSNKSPGLEGSAGLRDLVIACCFVHCIGRTRQQEL